MNKYVIILISVIFIIIVVVLTFQYIFSIYEIEYIVVKKSIKNGESTKIIAKPLNSLGIKVPFRRIEVHYSILKGSNLVELQEIEDGLKITAKIKMEGEVIINAHSSLAVLDSQIKININK